MRLMQWEHPSVRRLVTLAAFAAVAGMLGGCGGSAAPFSRSTAGMRADSEAERDPELAAPTATATVAPDADGYAFAAAVRPALIYIGNFGANDIVEFPATGTGNLTPATTLTGSGVLAPYLIYVDGSGQLWSANRLLYGHGLCGGRER